MLLPHVVHFWRSYIETDLAEKLHTNYINHQYANTKMRCFAKNIINLNSINSFWTSNISSIGQGTKSFLSLQSCASRIAQYAIYTWSKKHPFINCLPFRIRVDDYKITYLLKNANWFFHQHVRILYFQDDSLTFFLPTLLPYIDIYLKTS